MTSRGYEKLQSELSQLICNEKYKRMTSKNRDVYKDAVLACKSVVSNYKTDADVEPVKHGKWNYIGGYGYKYSCSVCINCAERMTQYCPNCGAIMDGKESENGDNN